MSLKYKKTEMILSIFYKDDDMNEKSIMRRKLKILKYMKIETLLTN